MFQPPQVLGVLMRLLAWEERPLEAHILAPAFTGFPVLQPVYCIGNKPDCKSSDMLKNKHACAHFAH